MTTGPARRLVVVIDGTRYECWLTVDESVTVGAGNDCTVHLPATRPVPTLAFRLLDDRLTVEVDGRTATGDPGAVLRIRAGEHEVRAALGDLDDRIVLDIRGRDTLSVGRRPGADVQVTGGPDLSCRRTDDGRWEVTSGGGEVFVNSISRPAGRHRVDPGDHIGWGTATLLLLDDELHVDAAAVLSTALPRLARSASTPPPGYPVHRRSPRIVHRDPEDEIRLSGAPTPEQRPAGQMAKLVVPPVAMLAVTVLMAVLRQNMLFVLGSGVTAVVTMVFSVTGYLRDRRAAAVRRAALEDGYRDHLTRRALQIRTAVVAQRRGAHYHYPDVSTLVRLARSWSPRVFEKTPRQHDFLRYRLGLGTVPATFTVTTGADDRVGQQDELARAAEALRERSARLDRMPITVDLRDGPVGYVGPRRLVVEQLQLLVNQLAVFHSYHDLQLVLVFPEAEHDDWSWARWFRHASLQNVNLRGFVHDQRSRDQVLSSLNQVLRGRRAALDEAGRGPTPVFGPHYLVVLVDESLAADHVVMELLRDDPIALGCSVVVVQETMSALHESVTTVIDIRDRDTGVLVLERGELRDTRFVPDHLPDGLDLEVLPRTIGALEHRQDLRSSIPEAVTFLETYGVQSAADLDVASRWQSNAPHRTLGVPLGLRGPGDVVLLDLHERGHGPHGLVAGTTGSGKSEIIQSYILSLAVCFHPHDVAFLLIDYKGGGMANLFTDLPHLLGTITNLDGAQSMRALVSINAELMRRQRVFAEHDVNHINQYQKLVRSGRAADPMPHLFLISDEFAELRSEQPEFMDELVSTARIGRSLGIHLILATQKPSGVVNDQIWSNSRFKLALKVADRSDSMEIIKTADAAEITLPGRAYLQVGNNEVYELFQSAWSGADHRAGAEQHHQDDRTIYAITELGQYRPLNPDLSGLDGAEDVVQVPTELEAVIDEIARVAEQSGVRPLPRPWLPPLPEWFPVTDLSDADPSRCWAGPKTPLRPVVGMVDIPSQQYQGTLRLDLSGDGHLLVFGSPGYGKSTFLQTLVMDLARAHSPEHLHVYLLDLGTNGLLPLRGLPHVADLVTGEDARKTHKLAARIGQELRRRRRLLADHSAPNIETYERASGHALPSVVIVLDGYEALRGSPVEDTLTELLTQVAREGAALGIHLTISAGRPGSFRPALSGNITTQLALRLQDDGDVRTIVGRSSISAEDLPGRGLLRADEARVFQTATPAPGSAALDVIESVRSEATELDAQWGGARPEPIPVVPDRMTLTDLLARPEVPAMRARGVVPVGLDVESVTTVGLELPRLRHVLVMAPSSAGVAEMLRMLWSALDRDTEVFVFDDVDGTLQGLGVGDGPEPRGALATLDAALAELSARQILGRSGSDLLRKAPRGLVLVADSSTIGATLGEDRTAELGRLLADGPAYGIAAVIGVPSALASKGNDPVSKVVKRASAGILRGAMSDQGVLSAPGTGLRSAALGRHEAFVVADGVAVRTRLPERDQDEVERT